MAMSDQRKKGAEWFEKVMTFSPPATGGSPFLEQTFDHLFADLWSRPGLGTRERRLITLTTLIGFGNEMALTLHFTGALESGDLTVDELEELILHAAHYGGWPGAAIASTVLMKLRAERAKAGK